MKGTTVAYKLCKLKKREMKEGIKEVIQTEVSIHAPLSHQNIVKFLCYMSTQSSIGIVCEYMRFILEDVLFGTDGDDGQ